MDTNFIHGEAYNGQVIGVYRVTAGLYGWDILTHGGTIEGDSSYESQEAAVMGAMARIDAVFAEEVAAA